MNRSDNVTKVLIAHITKDKTAAENLRDQLLPYGGNRLECFLWEENKQNSIEDLKRRIEETDLLLLLVASGIVLDEDWSWLQWSTAMSWAMNNGQRINDGHISRILLYNRILTPTQCFQRGIKHCFSSEVSKIKDFLKYFFCSTEFTHDDIELNNFFAQQNNQLDKLSNTISLLFEETRLPSLNIEIFPKAITLIVENPERLTKENLSQEIRIQSHTPESLKIFGLRETRRTNEKWSLEEMVDMLKPDNKQGWLIELANSIYDDHRGIALEPSVVQSTFQTSDGSLYKPILYSRENCPDRSERFTVILVNHFSAEWVYNAPDPSLATLLTASVLGARLQWEVCRKYLGELDRLQLNGTDAIRKKLKQVKVSFENIEKDAEFRSKGEAGGVNNEVRLRDAFDHKDGNTIAHNMLEQKQYKKTLLNDNTQDNVNEVIEALTKLKSLNSIVMDMVGKRYSQLLTQLHNQNLL